MLSRDGRQRTWWCYVKGCITIEDSVRGQRGEPASIGLDFTKGLPWEGEQGEGGMGVETLFFFYLGVEAKGQHCHPEWDMPIYLNVPRKVQGGCG